MTDAFVNRLAKACTSEASCGAFSFNSKPGAVSSCIKTYIDEPWGL